MDLPARLGKYELQEFLGGSMAHVYRAQDTVLNRTVAVKILTEEGCNDRETKERFLQEARLAGGLSHDNIIRVFDFGEDNGRPFMIMEFLKGETLRDAIKGGRTGDLKKRLRIALQVVQALEYIHSHKIVHRDIKPDNVHIDLNGRVRLMDFGIAKAQNVKLTKAGFTLGTPYYMAPEQVMGQNVTHLVDIYAFGILLYELLSGTKPISGESIEKVFHKILNDPLPAEPLRQSGAPPAVRDVVMRCTAKNPQDRYSSFELMRAELERILKGMPAAHDTTGTATPASTTGASRSSGSFTPRAVSTTTAAAVAEFAQGSGRTVTPGPMHPAPQNMPSFLRLLPPQFHTQEWFIAIVALGVLACLGVVVAVISAVVRRFS